MDIKYLIIRPKYGLCNQLMSISKGIIFSLISKRDLIYCGFQLDYRNENNICKFDEIIDINNLQNIINSLNLNIKIYSNNVVESVKIKTFSDETISYIKNFIPLLNNDENKNEIYLDIDNPISANIPEEYEKIFTSINVNIKFTEKYIDLANNIKKKLNLNNYSSIHLRLEDDAIRFMKEKNKILNLEEINKICIDKYLNELDYLKDINNNIYICTSLCINDNVNNELYKELKIKYNLLDKNDFINCENIGEFREIFGIIDYIIAKDSIYFIGADWSSFSIYIYEHHKMHDKAVKLLDIYKTINDEL